MSREPPTDATDASTDGATDTDAGHAGATAASTDADEGTTGTGGDESPSRLSDRVEAALRRVRDPDAELTVFEAGLVEEIHVTDGQVTIDADLSDFPPGEAESVTATMVRAVSAVPGVERAHVEHVGSVPETEGRRTGIESADRIVAVASAKGGVGKSTVATSLACALAAEGETVGIFDADIHGPNVPELLSVSGPVHSDEDGNPVPVDAEGLDVMSVGLMSSSAPLAWRGAMAHDALSELFEETAWDDPDTVVLDLPPGTGDVALTTLQETRVDGVVFVTTPFHAAVSDTHRSIQLFEENDVPVLGVVSNMGEFVCEECGHPHDLFDGPDPIESLNVPVLAEIPFDPEMQDTPSPSPDALPAHARRLGRAVAERFEEIWSVEIPDEAVDIRGLPSETRYEAVDDGWADTPSGERFYLVSDRDPTPVRNYLLESSDVDDEELEPFEVRRPNPETWLLRTVRP
jgi:ATP-binding protein involved in chromosome partitioning